MPCSGRQDGLRTKQRLCVMHPHAAQPHAILDYRRDAGLINTFTNSERHQAHPRAQGGQAPNTQPEQRQTQEADGQIGSEADWSRQGSEMGGKEAYDGHGGSVFSILLHLLPHPPPAPPLTHPHIHPSLPRPLRPPDASHCSLLHSFASPPPSTTHPSTSTNDEEA